MFKTALQDRLFSLIETAPDARSIQVKDWSAVGSLKGPREGNQDRVCAIHISHAMRPADDLLVGVVCDGMGGMAEGGMAATLALSVFITELAASRHTGGERLRLAVLEANRLVFSALSGRGGTTLTAVAASPRGDTLCAHAGDSRLYSYLAGELSLVSKDDTISGIVAGGPEQIEDAHDNRLVQFVGMGPELQPHISKLSSSRDQSWILTSDGAHGLGRSMMRAIASNARSSVDLVRKILFVVDAAPLGDNASVVAITPSSFEPPKRNKHGINITVWTPTDHLELWIDDKSFGDPVRPISGVEEHAYQAKPMIEKKPSKSRGKAIKKAKAAGSRQARKASPASAAGDDVGDAAPPLLNIVFGDEPDQ